MRMQKVLLVFFLLSSISISAQTTEEIFNQKYEFLNEDYSLNIDSKTFEKGIIEHSIIKQNIRNYKDSVMVVLMIEFEDWKKVNLIKRKITYTWLRLSYHLWLSVPESKNLAADLGFSHPYLLIEALRDETFNTEETKAFFDSLKTKMNNENSSLDIVQKSKEELLDLALVESPVRKNDYMEMIYLKEHGSVDKSKIGKGCGKPNCCQTSK